MRADGNPETAATTGETDSGDTDWGWRCEPPVVGSVDGLGSVGQRAAVLGLVVGLFAVAVGVGRGTVWLAGLAVEVGEPGTLSGLLVSLVGLQVLGFGVGALVVVTDREEPLSYLRVGGFDWWVAFYGAAVGLGMMLLTTAVTLVFRVLSIDPAESAAAGSQDPLFYLVLFVVSTVVAVPMEELFFRGILQRTLAAVWHPAVAIGVASLLFVGVHGGVRVGTGGEALVVGLFLGLGVVLGVSYHLTGNLLVPVIGHVVFNGAQTLTQALEVAVQ